MSQSPLRVLHVTGALSREGGGVSAAIWGYAQAAAGAGVAQEVVGFRDAHTDADAPHDERLVWRAFPTRELGGLEWSPPLNAHVHEAAAGVDVLHLHGLRSTPGRAAARAAGARRRPLLVSAHGMLYPQLLARSAWKKRLLNLLWDDATRRTAACFHATSRRELSVLRTADVRAPVAVVPIGIDAGAFATPADRAVLEAQHPQVRDKRIALYLGLLEPKKGLLNLVAAWQRLRGELRDWVLVIAGPDRFGHEADVRRAAAQAGLDESVLLPGAAYGPAKVAWMTCAELFVLPTQWESFGIAVAESLAAATPVITTRDTPWEGLVERRCGWWIEYGVEPLVSTLQEATRLSSIELRAMGERGRAWVRHDLSWPRIGGQMADLYAWLAGRAEKPEFVEIGS